MKRRKMSQEHYSLSRQKMIGAAGGIFVAVLGAVPFMFSAIGFFVIDYGSNWRRVIVPIFGVILFGACVFYGIRDAVRRWRQISKLQELLGRMTDEERKEFDATIAHSDVGIFATETGKVHVTSLDH